MNRIIYRITFKNDEDTKEIEDTVALAIVAASCLYGEPAIRLDFSYTSGPSSATGKPAIVCAHHGEAGAVVMRILIGFCSHEYGESAFMVTRVVSASEVQP